MAKFSTKAASAFDKVLKRQTLVDFPGIIGSLEADLRNKQAETAYVEQEANRILTVKTYLDGSEIRAKGPLISNLTSTLDEEDIPRAIAVAKAVRTLMAAAREAWLLERKAIQQAGRYPPKWDDTMEKNRGPGVVRGAFKG